MLYESPRLTNTGYGCAVGVLPSSPSNRCPEPLISIERSSCRASAHIVRNSAAILLH
jgi:hypothetical protein